VKGPPSIKGIGRGRRNLGAQGEKIPPPSHSSKTEERPGDRPLLRRRRGRMNNQGGGGSVVHSVEKRKEGGDISGKRAESQGAPKAEASGASLHRGKGKEETF